MQIVTGKQIIGYKSVKNVVLRFNQILHGQELECYNILLSFSIDLNFPKKQTFCKVVVVDDDGDGIGNNVDNLGEAEFTLGQV